MLRTEPNPPIWYRVAVNLPVFRHRVVNYLRNHRKLDRLASFAFHDGLVTMPLVQALPVDLSRFQYIRISAFASASNKYLEDFDFIDCGAHAGLFSAQFSILSGQVQKLTAIEPNPAFFALLQLNISNARAAHVECVNAAVCDFEGHCRLVDPNGSTEPSDAMYIVADPDGHIPVITLATVLKTRTRSRVAIKLDVEGAEVPALRSAADLVRSLDRVVLFVEVHKDVLSRIGMSDVEMFAEINAIRSFKWVNASDGAEIDPRYPILEQTNLERQCDLIGIAA
jgi:FkbM family methyltransferase